MKSGHIEPSLPSTHYIDNRIYTDEEIFREELGQIFSKTWQFICHESEIRNPGDFRCTKVADSPIFIVRGDDGVVRAFHNACRHRAAEVVREESGNARSFTCFYHHWNYSLNGRLRSVTKPEGYEAVKLNKSELGLLELRVDAFAGFYFVSLDPDVEPLKDFLGAIVDPVAQPLGTIPLEVIHFSKAVIKTNWKLMNENSSERYHGTLHVLNRRTMPWVTGTNSPMKLRVFPNGHGGYWSDGEATVAYEKGGLSGVSGECLPGMRENEMRVVNIFPDVVINIRSNVVRVDRMIPLDPGHTLVEFRGLGVLGDSESARELRLQHHNMFWGPAGRNLPEDLFAVESQYRAMRADAVRYSVIAREEDYNPTDDVNLRTYYVEWGRLMNRAASAPFEGDRR